MTMLTCQCLVYNVYHVHYCIIITFVLTKHSWDWWERLQILKVVGKNQSCGQSQTFPCWWWILGEISTGYVKMLNCWWLNMNSRGITKLIRSHTFGSMNVCTKFHGNPFNSWDFSYKTSWCQWRKSQGITDVKLEPQETIEPLTWWWY